MTESYITVDREASGEFTEKKSRFIGYVKPVSCEEEAIEFINRIKSKHSDARHNAYAYIVSCNGIVNQRYSDDGEPQGTAGLPILEVLRRQEIINAVIVVTRYFGGILLGAPGLVRAYGKGDAAALDCVGSCKMSFCQPMDFTVDYSLYGKIQNFIEPLEIIKLPPEFGIDVTLRLVIPVGMCEYIEREITEITSGNFLLETGEKLFCKIK
ncbi:MAG: YigZ family protein [Clostridia bacterium]|nr:YigZ family protein [Clostridia bacterium]